MCRRTYSSAHLTADHHPQHVLCTIRHRRRIVTGIININSDRGTLRPDPTWGLYMYTWGAHKTNSGSLGIERARESEGRGELVIV